MIHYERCNGKALETKDEILSMVLEFEVNRFEHFTRAKKLSNTLGITNTYTLYNVDGVIMAMHSEDGSIFVIDNYKDAVEVYRKLRVKNFFTRLESIAGLALNIALLVKILKRKGWIK